MSPPSTDLNSPPRFGLNFDGFVVHNYYKGQYENLEEVASVKDVNSWQKGIRYLQKYCICLLVAPNSRQLHWIEVFVCCVLCVCVLCVCAVCVHA